MSQGRAAAPSPSAWRRRFHKGAVLLWKYEVEHVIGENDVVLSAAVVRSDIGQRATVHVLLPELAVRSAIFECFQREARHAAMLMSDHGERVFDVLKLESGEPFLVAERLEGMTLANVLTERGPIGPARAAELLAQACDAVSELHRHLWVHGGLATRSLFLANRTRGLPIVKVLDIGLSAVRGELQRLDGWLTPARVDSGDPLYLAPEQIDPMRQPDARADVWALGAILYELLVGESPFAADGLARKIELVVDGTVEAPSKRVPAVPRAVDEIVLTCLEKDRNRRFADAGELLSALEDAVADRSQTSVMSVPSSRPTPGPRESATEIRPMRLPIEPESAPQAVRPRGRGVMTVSAPLIQDDPTLVPSMVTGSDPSSQQLLQVRPHPLVPREAPPSRSLSLQRMLAIGCVVLAGLLAIYLVWRGR
ncbi:MAG: serine/threonine-protein kinase [Polyangiaceae bacterium]